MRYFLLPATTLLFLHALGVVEQAPHWAIATIEIIAALLPQLESFDFAQDSSWGLHPPYDSSLNDSLGAKGHQSHPSGARSFPMKGEVMYAIEVDLPERVKVNPAIKVEIPASRSSGEPNWRKCVEAVEDREEAHRLGEEMFGRYGYRWRVTEDRYRLVEST